MHQLDSSRPVQATRKYLRANHLKPGPNDSRQRWVKLEKLKELSLASILTNSQVRLAQVRSACTDSGQISLHLFRLNWHHIT